MSRATAIPLQPSPVLALEPQRVIHQIPCANVALDGAMDVLAERGALAAHGRLPRIPAFDHARPNSFGSAGVATGEGGVQVPARTLDSFGLSRCNLLKVDAEGSELGFRARVLGPGAPQRSEKKRR